MGQFSEGYSIFKSALGGDLNFLGGTYHHNSILLTPYLHILNSILHLEPLCATPSSNISNYLIPPIPGLQIIFRSPSHLGNRWKWYSIALRGMFQPLFIFYLTKFL